MAWEEIQIDHLTSRLARMPGDFDVLLLPNLYGDIISDLCAGLVGGLGLIPGANIGWEYAVFEPVHGSAPDIAGQGKANPIAMILSGAMMLRHLGELAAAENVEWAVDEVLARGEVRTPDLGGSVDDDAGRRGDRDAGHRLGARPELTRSVVVRVIVVPVGAPTGVPVRPGVNSRVGRGSRSSRRSRATSRGCGT